MKLLYNTAVALLPIMMGYFPVGVSFAVVAAESGLSSGEIIAMSVFVLGAASQVAAVPLIESGEGIFYIFLVTFLVNFRHAALSASLSPSLRDFSNKELAVFSYALTDESFTIHALNIQNKKFNKRGAIAVNIGTHLIWIISTVAGCSIGLFIVEKMSFVKLEFALPAMFLSIIAIYVKSKIAASESAMESPSESATESPSESADKKQPPRRLQTQIVARHLIIIFAAAAMTLILLFADYKSLSFFVPALIIAAFMFGANKFNPAPKKQ